MAEPRQSFAGHTLETPWTELQLAYFAGCAMWTYLNMPFLLAAPGVESTRIDPWSEGGETWERLRVRFPDTIATHSTEQTLYVGPDGLLKRHDYDVEIAGNTPGAHFISGYRDVQGIMIPTRRRIFPRQPREGDGRAPGRLDRSGPDRTSLKGPETTMPDPESKVEPHAREAQIFPRLDSATINRLMPYGEIEVPVPGTPLFEQGARAADFFVVLEGAIELSEQKGAEAPETFRCYRACEFTGELHLFNDRALLVTGRATAGIRVLRIRRPAFRRMVSTEADIGELIMRAFILRRVELIALGQGGVTVVGSALSPDSQRLRTFLTRNAHPHRFLDLDADPAATAALDGFPLVGTALPLVILPGGETLSNPTTTALASALGIAEATDPDRIYDVAVVGAGPAGLAAAVYAASEGLSTIVIESDSPGGQAGTSSRIENYLGFPTGISGQALAGRAQVQAQKFGARLVVSRPVVSLERSETAFVLGLEGSATVEARAVVVATGARYRRLSVPGYARLESRGIYYAATPMEAQFCRDQEVVVVGGGNSAGQAAVFLSRTCRHVRVLVRAEGLAATMSDYLVQRILDSPEITLRSFTEVTGVEGEQRLTALTWADRRTGSSETRQIGGLFVMIGADPNTDWLQGCATDSRGFIITGQADDGTPLASPYATRMPGVFAVGDVRSGSVKRVASSVGEGSVVISAVHQYLAGVPSRRLFCSPRRSPLEDQSR